MFSGTSLSFTLFPFLNIEPSARLITQKSSGISSTTGGPSTFLVGSIILSSSFISSSLVTDCGLYSSSSCWVWGTIAPSWALNGFLPVGNSTTTDDGGVFIVSPGFKTPTYFPSA